MLRLFMLHRLALCAKFGLSGQSAQDIGRAGFQVAEGFIFLGVLFVVVRLDQWRSENAEAAAVDLVVPV